MLVELVASIALLQQPQQPAQSALRASPVARVVISPAERTVTVGESARFTAQALDSAGRPVEGVRFNWLQAGGFFEGRVGPDGTVRAGAVGTLPMSVVAIAPGARPRVERVEVRIVPGPAARIELASRPGRLAVGQRVRLEAGSFSAAGDARDDRITWTSSAPSTVAVRDGGLTALAPGRATLTARAGNATERFDVEVIANNIARIEVQPERTDARQGDVIRFRATPRDARGQEIAGLTPSWSLSPGHGVIDSDGAFVGYEPGTYVVTVNYGDRTADAVVQLRAREARRRANVVGRLPRTEHWTGEVWVHPNGQVAYLSTVLGGDRVYTIDIRDPAAPTVVDSIMVNARSVNDVMTTADGRWMVITREGADNRRNGIAIASLEDPLRPKQVAEFTDGATDGVHSAFVYTQPRHGTHVYMTNNGTGALDIVDLNDPLKPRRVASWRTERGDAARSLHDVDVQDGLAYVSYWNDGLVVLDVGNGIKGGSPSNPQLVTQYRYDLESLYANAEAEYGGKGFIRGTHTAWRAGRYVFVSDEVFPPPPSTGGFDIANLRAFGRLQVIDVSDITGPRSVAWYEPEYGGVHNIWVAGDTLYMGTYNGGFRAFDISGELRGDLGSQGREIAHVMTGDSDAKVPNKAMTWGVVVKDGLAYVNDMLSGLWIVRLEPRAEVVP